MQFLEIKPIFCVQSFSCIQFLSFSFSLSIYIFLSLIPCLSATLSFSLPLSLFLSLSLSLSIYISIFFWYLSLSLSLFSLTSYLSSFFTFLSLYTFFLSKISQCFSNQLSYYWYNNYPYNKIEHLIQPLQSRFNRCYPQQSCKDVDASLFMNVALIPLMLRFLCFFHGDKAKSDLIVIIIISPIVWN